MKTSNQWFLATALLIGTASNAAIASPGVYFGVGLADAKLNETGIDNETGKKLFVGYQVNRFIAVEAGYNDFGSYDSSSISATSELDGLEVSALASYPIGTRFSVFGRLGIWEWDYDVEGQNGNPISSKSGHNIVHGAGVDFKLNQRFKVRGSWDEYRVDDGIANLISLNMLYTF